MRVARGRPQPCRTVHVLTPRRSHLGRTHHHVSNQLVTRRHNRKSASSLCGPENMLTCAPPLGLEGGAVSWPSAVEVTCTSCSRARSERDELRERLRIRSQSSRRPIATRKATPTSAIVAAPPVALAPLPSRLEDAPSSANCGDGRGGGGGAGLTGSISGGAGGGDDGGSGERADGTGGGAASPSGVDGVGGGRCGTARAPQSEQSLPSSQKLNSAPGPPSSQSPSES